MIPQHAKAGIDRYVEEGCPTGSFLYAVLTNSLYNAVVRADETNRANFHDIILYVLNYVPNCSYGTPKKVKAWLNAHQTDGKLHFDSERVIPIAPAIEHDRERRLNCVSI